MTVESGAPRDDGKRSEGLAMTIVGAATRCRNFTVIARAQPEAIQEVSEATLAPAPGQSTSWIATATWRSPRDDGKRSEGLAMTARGARGSR
jgi:hypothetical protein